MNIGVYAMFGKKKDKKKKQPVERISSLTANGTLIEVINFSLTHDENNAPLLQVRTKEECVAMHYDEVDFELKTTVKMVKVKGKFKNAKNEKHYKLYEFDIVDYAQYFI